LLRETSQRTCAEDRIMSLLRHPLPRVLRQLHVNLTIRQATVQVRQQQHHDLLQLLERERLEENDVVDPIQKLRPEPPSQFREYLFPHALRDRLIRQTDAFNQETASDV